MTREKQMEVLRAAIRLASAWRDYETAAALSRMLERVARG